MARVVIERLSKKFRGPRGEEIRALNDFTLTVEDRELLVLAGPSGSGKTTLLRLLAGLEKPDQGSITIDGTVISNLPPERRNMAMVFQNAALYPHMTVRENVAFGLKIRRVARAEANKRVKEAAEVLGLTSCLDRLPMQISGGERQRAALGRALVRQPRIFLLDEPLSNLDPQTRLQLRTQIAALHERLGTTTIYVTHDQAESVALGQRIALVLEGQLAQVGTPQEIYHRPANLFAARFFGSPPMNLLRGEIKRDGRRTWFEAQSDSAEFLRVDLEEVSKEFNEIVPEKALVWGIRPEEISLVRASGLGKALSGMVEQVEFCGSDTFIRAKVAGHPIVVRAPTREEFKTREAVQVRIDQEHARFFDAATGKLIR